MENDFVLVGDHGRKSSTVFEDLDINYGTRANTFSIDATGRWCALGGKYLHVIDLENPTAHSPCKAAQKGYEIGAVEWNPNYSQASLIAAAANHQILVWSVDDAVRQLQLEAKVPSHSRAVSDLAWSRFEPHLLASCSADGYIFVWDLRDLKAPAQKFHSHTAPSRIKWNRGDSNVFASAHDRELCVWDRRVNGNVTVSFTAHVAAITYIDWSYANHKEILTCSQDKQIKFWDITNPKVYRDVLSIGAPVFQARYTPFGNAVVTVAQHYDFSLKLWNFNQLNSPVQTFSGFTGAIKGFDWRVKEMNEKLAYQLCSLSSDLHLRLWAMTPQIQAAARTHSRKKSLTSSTEFEALDMAQEFTVLQKNGIPGVELQEMDVSKRYVVASIELENFSVDVKMTFPELYPRNAAPFFEFLPSSTLSVTIQGKLRKILFETAQHQVEHNQPCITHCLSKLVLLLKHNDVWKLESEKSTTPDGSLTEEWEIIAKEPTRLHPPPEIISYVVKPTDTITGIAITHNMKPEQIKQFNQLYSNQLIPGQVLFLKSKGSETPPASMFRQMRLGQAKRKPTGPDRATQLLASLNQPLNGGDTPQPPHTDEGTAKHTNRKRSTSEITSTSTVPVEVMKEIARFCSETFTVFGTLTLTSELLVFEPHLTDPYVIKNGVLPYQIYVPMRHIFDCQMIPENPNFHYDSTLEISTLDSESSIQMYEFILEEKKLRSVYKGLITWVSQSQQSNKQSPNIDEKEEVAQPQHEETFETLPTLSRPSACLTNQHISDLMIHLPARFRFHEKWHMLYGTQVHGTSLNTFFSRLRDEGSSLLIIKDTNGHVFGGFASESWRVEPHFYGSAECFLFKLEPSYHIYHWSKDKRYRNFQCSRRDFIAMGGGSQFAIWIDSDLAFGSSGKSEAFNNDCLASAEDFEIACIEIWGFEAPTSAEFEPAAEHLVRPSWL